MKILACFCVAMLITLAVIGCSGAFDDNEATARVLTGKFAGDYLSQRLILIDSNVEHVNGYRYRTTGTLVNRKTDRTFRVVSEMRVSGREGTLYYLEIDGKLLYRR